MKYLLGLALLVPLAGHAQTAGTPVFVNTPDMVCGSGDYPRMCSQAEFAGLYQDFKDRWPDVPVAVKQVCDGSETLPEMEGCIIRTGMEWMKSHPGEMVCWMPGSVCDTPSMKAKAHE